MVGIDSWLRYICQIWLNTVIKPVQLRILLLFFSVIACVAMIKFIVILSWYIQPVIWEERPNYDFIWNCPFLFVCKILWIWFICNTNLILFLHKSYLKATCFSSNFVQSFWMESFLISSKSIQHFQILIVQCHCN